MTDKKLITPVVLSGRNRIEQYNIYKFDQSCVSKTKVNELLETIITEIHTTSTLSSIEQSFLVELNKDITYTNNLCIYKGVKLTKDELLYLRTKLTDYLNSYLRIISR